MRTIGKSILLYLLTGTVLLTAQVDPNLIVNCNRDDVMVFVNGEYQGDKTIELNMAPGQYEILVVERGREWNAQRFKDTVFVKDNMEAIRLGYTFTEGVFIDSIPQNAYIMYEDTVIGYTPLETNLNDVKLQIGKAGYQSRNIGLNTYHVQSGIKLIFTGDKKEKHFVDTPWFGVLIGSAVVLGATAAYFKIEADQKYDKYNLTRDKSLLDDIDRLDLYSGVAFGLLQVNFGYLIYQFIFNHN